MKIYWLETRGSIAGLMAIVTARSAERARKMLVYKNEREDLKYPSRLLFGMKTKFVTRLYNGEEKEEVRTLLNFLI